MLPSSTFEWVGAVIVLVGGTGRLARLATYDSFPPAEWLRLRLLAASSERWGRLWTCAFCLAPWIALADMAAGYWSNLWWGWWAANLWLTVSYAAAILVAYDEPPPV